MRRVERSVQAHGTDREEGAKAVEAIIKRFSSLDYLNDARYANLRAESLFRRGNSLRAIQYKLKAKGVPTNLIDLAIEGLKEGTADPDWQAAIAYSRRRRIGPWRGENRMKFRERDFSALVRQGFAWRIVLSIMDARSVHDCEANIICFDD